MIIIVVIHLCICLPLLHASSVSLIVSFLVPPPAPPVSLYQSNNGKMMLLCVVGHLLLSSVFVAVPVCHAKLLTLL